MKTLRSSLFIFSLCAVLTVGPTTATSIRAGDLAAGDDAQQESPCHAAEYAQFDFWVGTWEVHAAGQVAGTSEIISKLDGCAIHESWTSSSGASGFSYNFYDSAREQWHQTWIDANGAALYLDGGIEDGEMVLTDGINRVTWTPLPNGHVRQHWETTSDEGKTWTTSFDGDYRPTGGR